MQINITDLPSERFFVKLNKEFAYKINNSVTMKYGSIRKLAKVMNLWSGSLCSWRKNSNYPLKILSEICRLCEIDLNKEQQNIIELKSCFYKNRNFGNAKSKPIYPKFPITLTPELSSVIAHLFCDGCVSTEKNGYLHVHYYNKDRGLLEIFKEHTRKVFGDFEIYQSKNKGVDFVTLPSPVGVILKTVVPDFNGKTCRIPDFIKNSNDTEIKRTFVKAFADDEGSVKFKPPYRHIELSCSNENMLFDLRKMIEEFGIRCGTVCYKNHNGFDFYYFYVRGYENLKKFKESIDFIHKEKANKLESILNSKQIPHYGQVESKELVINLLKSGRKRTEIAKELNRNISTIDYHIRILRQKGVIN
ncbi:MAG: hypothetical protein QT00_C0002G0069 [archaeon GW2011_AR5]|nr:MAG: hypothetical protein QT00_C0002G0069 [archaeon GW2011_AR5]